MRLALDLAYGENWIGGAYYVTNLLRALTNLPDARRPFITLLLNERQRLPDNYPAEFSIPSLTYSHRWGWGIRKRIVYAALRTLAPQRYRSFEEAANSAQADLVFPLLDSPAPDFPTPWIGWIPDFQHRQLESFFPRQHRAKRDRIFERIVRDAPHIVVSSHAVLNDLYKFLPEARNKASVLSFTTVPSREWTDEGVSAVLRIYRIPNKFILLPNQFWRHKNHMTVFEAIRICRERIPDICLVCTGPTSDSRDPSYFRKIETFMSDNNLQDQIRILGLIPRLHQIQLVRAAAAVIQPSLFEGWSSLVEDSRALGKTIFLSDLPVHREQNPPRAKFFDPLNKEMLTSLILSEYPGLFPGPDLSVEAKALENQSSLVRAFAENFLSAASSVLGGP